MKFRSHRTAKTDHHWDDPTSWSVRSRTDDEKVGKVDDVLVDETGRACYLSVSLADDHARRVLVPLGLVTTDRDDKTVWVDGSADHLRSAPAYSGDVSSLNDEHERAVWSSFDASYRGDRHYERPAYRTHGWTDDRSDRSTGGEPLAKVGKLHDVKVASGDPDPRGWAVVGSDGETLGKVDYLLGDTDRMRVAYLVVEVDRSLVDEERHVLVPPGHVTLDRDDERVLVTALDRNRVGSLQPYREDTFDRSYEERLLRDYDASYTGDRRYEHPRFRNTSFAGGGSGTART